MVNAADLLEREVACLPVLVLGLEHDELVLEQVGRLLDGRGTVRNAGDQVAVERPVLHHRQVIDSHDGRRRARRRTEMACCHISAYAHREASKATGEA